MQKKTQSRLQAIEWHYWLRYMRTFFLLLEGGVKIIFKILIKIIRAKLIVINLDAPKNEKVIKERWT